MKTKILSLAVGITGILTVYAFSSGSGKSEQKEIVIGDQTWAAHNLDVDHFSSGEKIMQAQSASEWEKAAKAHKPALCYYNYNPGNGSVYGRLYNWYAVIDTRGLAPMGWHIPVDSEWQTLNQHLGGTLESGGKLKSAQGWKDNFNGTNESGFNAKPAGFCDNNGLCDQLEMLGCFWSLTEATDTSAYAGWVFQSKGDGHDHYVPSNDFFVMPAHKAYGYSVRCVKDK